MKRSRLHMFFIWMVIVALVFGGVPFHRIYADDTTYTPKDVSERLEFGDGITLTEVINGNDNVIYQDGILQTGKKAEVKSGAKLRLKYVWEIPKNKFLGTASGLTNSGPIKPKDTFKIALPDAKLLAFIPSKEPRAIEEGKDYGTWKVVKEGDKFFISGVFGDGIEGDPSQAAEALKEGFFEIEANAAGAGTFNLLPQDGQPPVPLTIIENLEVHRWTPGPFYKQGGYNSSNKYLTWSLITGFDNLRYAFEKGHAFYTEGGEYQKSKFTEKKNIAVYDILPKGIKIEEIQLKIPVYVATPDPDHNSLNFDANGNMLEDSDTNYKFVRAGQLSWKSYHQIEKIYKLDDSAILKRAPGETLGAFETRVDNKAQTDPTGMPAIGIYEGDDKTVVYVNLGDSPNKTMTYGDFYKHKPAFRDGELATLEDFLGWLKDNGKIDDAQWNIMKDAYLGGGHNGKILAWSVGIKVDVQDNDIDYAYLNDGHIRYTIDGESGGTLKEEASQELIQYYQLKSGVKVLRRLSFPVIKKWVDASGNAIPPVKDAVQVDVYRVDGGVETKIDGASILLTKDKSWVGTVTGLPIYDMNDQPIKYIVKEAPVEGFTSSVKPNNKDKIGYGFTITNTQNTVSNPKSITVKKVWNNDADKRPVLFYLEKKENASAEWTVVDRVELKDPWEHTFHNLDVSGGAEYQVREEKLLGYKKPELHKNDSDPNHIVYTFTNEKETDPATDFINIEVEKKWSKNKLGSAIIELYSTINGEEKLQETVILSHPNWSHTFKNYPKKVKVEENEYEVTYDVREVAIEGFTLEKEIDSSDPGVIKYTLTNTAEEIPTTDIKVEKKWVGDVGGEVTVELLADDKIVKDDSDNARTIVLNSTNSWINKFTNVYLKSLEGKTLTFTVREKPVAGYTPSITGNSASGFIITNTKNAVVKDIPVRKVWSGGEGGEVTVELYSIVGGTENKVAETRLNSANSWESKFENITIKGEGGTSIDFVVKELPVSGYDAPAISGNVNDGFTVTNTKTTTTTTTASGGGEEETTESSTEKTTEKTSPSSAQASTDTTETNTETTTEATTESADASTLTTEATTVTTTTTEAAPVVVITTAPTAPATTRTFEFIEIAEDIPLGVKTTAPINLELVLIEESVPLGGLPYTYSIPAEILVGIGMLILTIGLTIGRKL